MWSLLRNSQPLLWLLGFPTETELGRHTETGVLHCCVYLLWLSPVTTSRQFSCEPRDTMLRTGRWKPIILWPSIVNTHTHTPLIYWFMEISFLFANHTKVIYPEGNPRRRETVKEEIQIYIGCSRICVRALPTHARTHARARTHTHTHTHTHMFSVCLSFIWFSFFQFLSFPFFCCLDCLNCFALRC